MNKLEEVIGIVLKEIKPQHTESTYNARKSSLNRLLRFARNNGFEEPCQELYDAFTMDYKASNDIRFTLFHTVRLVDRFANTHCKDHCGRLLNEPPLPAESDVLRFFAACSFPLDIQVDINYLIVFSEHLIRQYDLSDSTVGQYRHSWIDIRRYCFDCGTSLYQKDTIKDYIQETAKTLQISSMDTLSARAEAAARLKNLRGSFDCVISRAVASFPVLLELCIPFLKEGGTLIAMKGAKADQEIDVSAHAMEVLGCKIAEKKHFQLVSPFDNSYEERCLIVIRCLRPAPHEYPRDFAAIKKKPL